MRLSEIRNQILMQTDHVPNAPSYFRYIDTLVNQAYRSIWDSRQWVFAIKQAETRVFPDYYDENVTVEVTTGSRQVQFSVVGAIANPLIAGQVIQLDGQEYTIDSVYTNEYLFLDRPYQGVTNAALTDWNIVCRNIWMPKDCTDILDIAWRDAPHVSATTTGSTTGIPLKRDALFGAQLQDTGNRPVYYTTMPDVFIPAPDASLAPTAAASLLQTSTYGTLNAGTYYFTFTYVLGGLDNSWYGTMPESEPWDGTLEVTIPLSGVNTILFDFPSTNLVSSDNAIYGIKIYAVQPLADGRRILTELRAALPAYGFFEQPAFASGGGTAFVGSVSYERRGIGTRHSENGGRSKCIRFWPRPNVADDELVMDPELGTSIPYTTCITTYLRRPPDLLADTDVPELPTEMHQLLVDRVCSDVQLRMGNMGASQMHERKYMDLLKIMETRYTTHANNTIVRGQGWGQNVSWQNWLSPGNFAIWRP